MEKHVTLVAALQIGFGVLGVLAALILFVAVVGGGILSSDPDAMTITSIVGSAVGGFLFLVSIPGIIGGIGLLKYQPWSRILVLIISCLELLNIPFGTAMAVYSGWVLLNDKTAELFEKKVASR